MVIVFKVSDNIKPKMIKFYENMARDKKPPYSVFQAASMDTIVTLYESGKVMFQGISADMEADIWATLERKLNNRDVLSESKKKDKTDDKKEEKDYSFLKYISSIGSDEVGTGDYFGPIVVTASYVDKSKIPFLEELNVGDSKKITDDKIKEIAPLLIKEIPHATFCFDNTSYNNLKDSNMNAIKAILHNKALINLLNQDEYSYERIVIDQFVHSQKYFEYLKEAPNVVRNLFFLTKAEDKVFSVAVSSIISRYTFLVKMNEMEKELGTKIPLGAGSLVDDFAKKLIEDKGISILDKYTKKNFKNTEKITQK